MDLEGPHPEGKGRWRAGRESQSLDDFAVVGTPQPSGPGNERVRNIERQRTAGERETVGEQMGAEFGQEPIGTGAVRRAIDKPRQSGGKLHRAILGRRVVLVTPHQLRCASMPSSLNIRRVGEFAAQNSRRCECKINAAQAHDPCRDFRRRPQW